MPNGHALKAEVTLSDSRDLIQVVERLRRMLDLDANMEAVSRALPADPLLQPLIERWQGLRLRARKEVTLVNCRNLVFLNLFIN